MNIKNLFTDDDAVSPVIGVILMVAITVILAAVIGAFVLDLGGSQEKAPQASWSFEYDDDGDGWSSGTANDKVTISHDGGDDVDNSSLTFTFGGQATGDLAGSGFTGSLDTWSAGKSLTYSEAAAGTPSDNLNSGDDVQIVWQSSSGDSSSVIGEGQIP